MDDSFDGNRNVYKFMPKKPTYIFIFFLLLLFYKRALPDIRFILITKFYYIRNKGIVTHNK